MTGLTGGFLRRLTLGAVLAFGTVTLAPPLVASVAAAKKKRKPTKKRARHGKKREAVAEREIQREGELTPRKEYGPAEDISKTKDLKPLQATPKGPTLSIEDVNLGEKQMEVMMDDKLDEEIQLAHQLLDYESECESSAPVRFRVADLYWEKSKRAFFKSNDSALSQKQRERSQKDMGDLQTRTIAHYQKIADDCADYSDYAKVLFYLGKALSEVNRAKEGASYFQRVIKEYPDSPWVANAWFMVGEYYFNTANDPIKALKAYTRAADFPASSMYGYAIYKQGWCFINVAEWAQALERFEQVIHISEDQKQDLDERSRSGLRKEGIRDYVRVYANIGNEKQAYRDFRKVAGLDAVQQMMESLGNWYVEQGEHKKLITVYNDYIKHYPDSTRVPILQGRIVDATANLGDKRGTVVQAKLLTDYFGKVRTRVAAGAFKGEDQKQVQKDLSEAEEIAENTLRRLAIEYHKDAKKLRGTAEDQTYRLAHDLYAHYLAVFPKPREGAEVNYVFFMRFYFAEVLYKLEKFKDAAENYSMVVDMNPHPKEKRDKEVVLTAAEEAVRSYDELVEDLDRKNPPEIAGMAPKPIPEIKQKLIDACQRYIRYVGSEGDKIVEIRYKMARIYYTYNHFDQAAPAFNDIVKNHPTNTVACLAANYALDIYNGEKNYRALKESARAYLDAKDLACGDEDKKKFAQIEERSSFFLVKSEFEDKKKYIEAARAYLQFYKDFPASESADDAVYNAAVNYDLGNRLDQANEVRRFLVEKLPTSPLVPDTLFSIAQIYERIVDFDSAAKYLEMFAQRYPKDSRTKDAIYNAGVYRATLHDFEGAKSDRQRFLSLYPSDGDARNVSFSMCEALEKQAELMEAQAKQEKRQPDASVGKLWEAAHDCYFKYVQNRDYAREDTDQLCQAQFRRGEIMREKTKYDKGYEEMKSYLQKNWPTWKREGADKVPRCAAAVAEIQFREVAAPYKRYGEVTISELNPTDKGKKKFDTSLKAKVEARDAVIERYKAIVEIGVAEWALAALYQIGDAYRESIDALLKAPIPDKIPGYKLTDEDKGMLRQQLREMATPIEQTAIEAYQLCVTKANELGVYNRWSVRALDRLQKLRPEAYPLIVEQVVPLKFEDPLVVVRNGLMVMDKDEWKAVATAPGAR
ncbi:MAG: tetratricopeptide repeat protein [Myxococcota bacterium]